MTVRVGINGFGRIGRNFFRAVAAAGADIEIVAVNDLGDNATLAHLLKYDTHPRPLPGRRSRVDRRRHRGRRQDDQDPRRARPGQPAVGRPRRRRRHRVDRLLHRRRPRRAAHVDAGAKKVIISAPATDEDVTIVMGVNDDDYDPADAHDHLQRLVHDELPRPAGQGARRRVRHRARPDDHDPRLHRRTRTCRTARTRTCAAPAPPR